MFVYYAFEDQGSGLVIQGYTEAARAMGHEVCVYGRDNPKIPLNYSLDIASCDAVIFLFEWTTQLRYEDQLDMLRLMTALPRERRVILDGDGNYNDPFTTENDYNHKDQGSSRRWCEICDSVTDKICQPTLQPFRKHVRPFLFYAYNPAWEVPIPRASSGKEFGMIYVGHAKFRWYPMSRVLRAVEKVRDEVGRIAVVGHGWGELPWWATTMKVEDSYLSDPQYLKKLGVEMLPPVPFKDVIATMSKAVFNPLLLRPTFNTMKLVTPRMFETPAANTVPLFAIDREHIREIYGDAAADNLVLDEASPDVVANIARRPDDFRDIQLGMRKHLSEHHSHAARLRQLIEIIES